MVLIIKSFETGDIVASGGGASSSTADSNDALLVAEPGSQLIACIGTQPVLSLSDTRVDAHGTICAVNYENLPQSSISAAGIVQLSSSLISSSTSNAATSAAVAQLYPATCIIDLGGSPSAVTVKSSTTGAGNAYLRLCDDTSNVGINCTPSSTSALDVQGNIRCTGDMLALSDARTKVELQPIVVLGRACMASIVGIYIQMYVPLK